MSLLMSLLYTCLTTRRITDDSAQLDTCIACQCFTSAAMILSSPLNTPAIFLSGVKVFAAALLAGASAVVRRKEIRQVRNLAPKGSPKAHVAWQRQLLTAAQAFRIPPSAMNVILTPHHHIMQLVHRQGRSILRGQQGNICTCLGSSTEVRQGSMQLTEREVRKGSEHQEAYLGAAWAELGLEAGPGMRVSPWVPQRLAGWCPPPW